MAETSFTHITDIYQKNLNLNQHKMNLKFEKFLMRNEGKSLLKYHYELQCENSFSFLSIA